MTKKEEKECEALSYDVLISINNISSEDLAKLIELLHEQSFYDETQGDNIGITTKEC